MTSTNINVKKLTQEMNKAITDGDENIISRLEELISQIEPSIGYKNSN